VERSVIMRTITVAAGRFPPGQLGELTQQVLFEMIDAVLAETRAGHGRIRDLPARVVVYLLLTGCLFAVRVAEVDVDVGCQSDFGVAGHFVALIRGHRPAYLGG
jgi:hypothetical protein